MSRQQRRRRTIINPAAQRRANFEDDNVVNEWGEEWTDDNDDTKNDPFILAVGSKLLENHRESHLTGHLSSKMRDLALLLRQMQIIDPNVKLSSDCLRTDQATNLLKSIQIVSGFDPETGLVKKPSMPNRLGPSINIAWDILRNDVLLNQTLPYEGKQKEIFEYDSAQRLFKSEWKFKISSNAEKSRKAALTKV
ncbi:unnamed protein product [Bemisia tabaci]|uniref:Uncharacterized protein n=1 Tax=Bemisia tabaci TaxID=7038 RepID=A0A9P0AMG0_BEMTA|nr:unnamed protein product [Bemisia tabaci]